MPRSIIIGDVHGCARELERLIEKLHLSDDDRLYFLGDLINRGPDSHKVVKMVRKLPNARSILGNHELRILSYWQSEDKSTLKDYDFDTIKQLSKKDRAYIEKMEGPILLEDKNIILAHAGFLPDIKWQKQGLDITTEIQVISPKGKARRRKACPDGTPWYEPWDQDCAVIYGHWPKDDIHIYRHTIGLDTGCVYGGKLSALIIEENRYVQVSAAKDYS